MEIQDLLGRPIHSEEVKDFLSKYGLPQNPTPNYDAYGNLFCVKANNKAMGIHAVFTGYIRYSKTYGEPIGNYHRDRDQLILHEITVDTEVKTTGKLPSFALPFDLAIGDDKKTIEQKTGKKLGGKLATSYGTAYDAVFDESRLIAALDTEGKLIWLRLFKLELYEKERIRLKTFLKTQNKNIDPNRIPEIQAFASEIPIPQWRKRMAEGDDMFSEESIAVVETTLTDYVQTLCDTVQKKNATTVYNSVGKLVRTINKINDKYGLIETLERDELGEWINILIRKTGIILDDNMAITEEYREW